jgi:hypothetical protein
MELYLFIATVIIIIGNVFVHSGYHHYVNEPAYNNGYL